MATNNIKARKEEKEEINVHDPLELSYWSNLFGVKKKDVLEAVRAVGDNKNEVEKYLKRMHHIEGD